MKNDDEATPHQVGSLAGRRMQVSQFMGRRGGGGSRRGREAVRGLKAACDRMRLHEVHRVVAAGCEKLMPSLCLSLWLTQAVETDFKVRITLRGGGGMHIELN